MCISSAYFERALNEVGQGGIKPYGIIYRFCNNLSRGRLARQRRTLLSHGPHTPLAGPQPRARAPRTTPGSLEGQRDPERVLYPFTARCRMSGAAVSGAGTLHGTMWPAPAGTGTLSYLKAVTVSSSWSHSSLPSPSKAWTPRSKWPSRSPSSSAGARSDPRRRS